MNKSIFSVISALLCFLFTTPSHADAILSITSDSLSVSIGTPVTFTINVSGLGSAIALGSYDLSIGFDPTLLTFDQVIFGDPNLGDQLDIAHLGLNAPLATPDQGSVNLIEFSLDDPATLLSQQASSFTLATLFFNTFADGTSPITLTVNSLTDATASDITYSSQNGSLTVVTAVPLPLASLLMLSGLGVICMMPRRSHMA